jgi:outer membrane protein OmpA-like peptidoglycan-associated protein
MIRSDELEFEFEDETEDELEYEQSGMVPGLLRIQVLYDRSRPGSREFEYEDEGELFDPAPPPRGAVLLTKFGPSSAVLTREHRVIIPKLAAAMLRGWPKDSTFCWSVSITGHEDEIGNPANYRDMGMKRAQAVKDALLKQLDKLARGMPAASRPKGRLILTVATAGPTRPIRSNVTAEGRAMNRRVEVTARRPEFCRDMA